jgi:hypothetical protein
MLKVCLRYSVVALAYSIALVKKHKEPYLWLAHYFLGRGGVRYLEVPIQDARKAITLYGPADYNPLLDEILIGSTDVINFDHGYIKYTVGGMTLTRVPGYIFGEDTYDWHDYCAINLSIPKVLTKVQNLLCRSKRVVEYLEQKGILLYKNSAEIEVADVFWLSLGGKPFTTRFVIRL